MPLLLTGRHGEANYALWQMTETHVQLLSIVGEDDAAFATAGLSSGKRVTERLAARALFKTAFPGHCCPVGYDRNGRPFLHTRQLHVSFSHTLGYVAMALAPREVGIDIEQHGGKALRISSRFLNDDELARVAASPSPEIAATAMWSAKETAFKIIGSGVYDFRRTLDVSPAIACGDADLDVLCTTSAGRTHLMLHCQVFDWGVLTVGVQE